MLIKYSGKYVKIYFSMKITYPSFDWECVPGSGAFLFPTTFLPCRDLSGGSLSVAYPYAVHDPLAGGHAFHFCWLLAHSGDL